MKRKLAKKHLMSLYFKGLLPSNFTPEHEYFELAIKYIKEYGHFDYNEFISNYV